METKEHSELVQLSLSYLYILIMPNMPTGIVR